MSLPPTPVEVSSAVLSRLHPEEQAAAQQLKGYRKIEYVGGRLAARAALAQLEERPAPVLQDPRGAPTAGPKVSLSISHKRTLVVALAARSAFGAVGVDLEDLQPPRPGIERMVLTPSELEVVEAMPESRRWTATLLRFSIKEAIYKALAPRLQRYIDFQEAEVTPATDGTATVRLLLKEGPLPADIEARYSWLEAAVLSTVRARWSSP
jgi:4'-phosphopantetheinyl transferase EntD